MLKNLTKEEMIAAFIGKNGEAWQDKYYGCVIESYKC